MTSQVSTIAQNVPQDILAAIRSAARKTGVDFGFLVEKAGAESNFNPAIEAKTSSATGLFQFIESTWLGMIQKHGAKYGLGEVAKNIEMKDGKLCVNGECSLSKEEILALRKDPKLASFMAAEFSADNKRYLEENTNTEIGATELYLAHFMGAKGAAEFLNRRAENGTEVAKEVFVKEARANKNVFFETNGKARSLDEVYDFFAGKFDTQELQFKRETKPSSHIASYTHTQHAINGFTTVPVQHTPIPPTLTIAQALSFSEDRNATAFGLSKMVEAQRTYAQSLMLMAQHRMFSALPSAV